MSNNLSLWDSVCKTDPKNTKPANVRGNKITAIAPQTQIMKATEKFGSYGFGWGFKTINFDYSMLEKTGIVVFNGVFYYTLDSSTHSFPISSSISAYRDNAMLKPDSDFAKKVETDALTKALSKLGFNADVFMGLYDDHKYVQMMEEEFKKISPKNKKIIGQVINSLVKNDMVWIEENWSGCISDVWNELDEDVISKLNAVANQS